MILTISKQPPLPKPPVLISWTMATAFPLVSILESLPNLKLGSYTIAGMILLKYIIYIHSSQKHVVAFYFIQNKIWTHKSDLKASYDKHLAPCSPYLIPLLLHSLHSKLNGLIPISQTPQACSHLKVFILAHFCN